MKITCSREKLLDAVNTVQKAISLRTTLPMLEGILLESDENLRLTGNDMEIAIECHVDADIQRKGAVVLNSKMFGDIIRKISDMDVVIEMCENNAVSIECGSSRFKIKGLPPQGFPTLPDVESISTFTVNQRILKDMIRQTIFVASTDQSTPVFTGTLIECKNGELTFVSTDRVARMAIRKNLISGNNMAFSVIVPSKTLNEIAKILQPGDDLITICMSKNQVLFNIGNCKVLSRLLEGDFFNYKSMILGSFEARVIVKTRELLSCVERACLVTMGEKRHPVVFNISDSRMVLTCNTELGEVTDEVAVETEGTNLCIAFNPMFFTDILRAIEEEKVQIDFASSIGPCTVRSIEAGKFAYIIGAVRR